MRFTRICPILLAMLSVSGAVRADAIHNAVADGDLETVKRLIASNPALIHSEGNDGMMPIHLAAGGDRPAILRYLLANGAGVNDRVVNGTNHIGATPLFIAVEKDHTELAIELIQKDADVNAALTKGPYRGTTPLHNALGFGDRVLTEKLLAKDAYVNVAIATGETPLFSILTASERTVSEPQRLSLIRILLTKHADVSAVFRGKTALHIASERGWLSIATLLLDHGIDVNAKASSGLTPFGIASKAGNTKMMDLLKSHGGAE